MRGHVCVCASACVSVCVSLCVCLCMCVCSCPIVRHNSQTHVHTCTNILICTHAHPHVCTRLHIQREALFQILQVAHTREKKQQEEYDALLRIQKSQLDTISQSSSERESQRQQIKTQQQQIQVLMEQKADLEEKVKHTRTRAIRTHSGCLPI